MIEATESDMDLTTISEPIDTVHIKDMITNNAFDDSQELLLMGESGTDNTDLRDFNGNLHEVTLLLNRKMPITKLQLNKVYDVNRNDVVIKGGEYSKHVNRWRKPSSDSYVTPSMSEYTDLNKTCAHSNDDYNNRSHDIVYPPSADELREMCEGDEGATITNYNTDEPLSDIRCINSLVDCSLKVLDPRSNRINSEEPLKSPLSCISDQHQENKGVFVDDMIEVSYLSSDIRRRGDTVYVGVCQYCDRYQNTKQSSEGTCRGERTQETIYLMRYDPNQDAGEITTCDSTGGLILSSVVVMDGPYSTNNSPRHPDYRDISNRLFSFATWRHERVQDPTRLANHGFFYTGEGDLVRCFYCSIGLKDFIESDDALMEHVRYSGDCPFLLELLGTERLAYFKEKLRTEYPAQLPNSELAETKKPTENVRVPADRRGGTQRYKHPEYQPIDVRLASFTGWPRELVQTPHKVAEAGFYYTGTTDVVRCFACDGGLQRWDPTDDPWIEHCRWFPFCPFAKETKGDSYISQVQSYFEGGSNQQKVSTPTKHQVALTQPVDRLLNQMAQLGVGEKPGRPVDKGSHTHNVETQEHIVSKGSHTKTVKKVKDTPPWRSEVVEIVLDMGFKERDVEKAVSQLKAEKRSESVEAIIELIETMTTRVEPLPTQEPKAEDVLAEHLRLKSILVCNGCHKEDTNALFLPCQHHRYCINCSKQMTHCPVCGQCINHVVKTYTA